MTNLERLKPDLTVLAGIIGQKIGRDGKWYVLKPSGRALIPVAHSDGAKVERMLYAIIEARKQPSWGTPYERAGRGIEVLRTAVYMPGHIIEWHHNSLDHGHLAYSFGDWDAGIYLLDHEPIRVKAWTREQCLETLATRCRALLRST